MSTVVEPVEGALFKLLVLPLCQQAGTWLGESEFNHFFSNDYRQKKNPKHLDLKKKEK